MVTIELFRFRKGDGLLYRLHPGAKLLSLIFLSIGAYQPGSMVIAPLLLFTLIVSRGNRPKLSRLYPSTLRILFVLFLSISLIEHRNKILLGWEQGLDTALTFFLLIVWGNIYTSTTSTEEFQSTIYSILKPLPFISRGTVATMAGITLKAIPLLENKLQHHKEAGIARGLVYKKNPWSYIKHLVLPLLIYVFIVSEEITRALQARSYSYHRSYKTLPVSPKDILFCVGIFLLSVLLFLTP